MAQEVNVNNDKIQETTEEEKPKKKEKKIKKVLNGVKKASDEAFSTLDAALTILNNYPETDESNTNLSFSKSANPLDFILDIIKKTKGYDWVIGILGGFISAGLPFIESAMKVAILANLRNLFSCTINPVINEDILREGVVFSLDDVDPLQTLDQNPLWKDFEGQLNKGRFNYFGCYGFEYPGQLVNAGDFNAFLWYVKNRANGRVVWRGVKPLESILNVRTNSNTLDEFPTTGKSYLDKEQPYFNRTYKQKEDIDQLVERRAEYINSSTPKKDEKDFGIITLEFNASSESLTDAEGNRFDHHIQTPTNNNIHVFVGNTMPYYDPNDGYYDLKMDIDVDETNIEHWKVRIANSKKMIKNLKKEIGKIDKKDPNYSTIKDSYKKNIEAEEKAISELEKLINSTKEKVRKSTNKLKRLRKQYRDFTDNYYYGRTLLELNYDYIMSLRLLDPVVVASQLLDSVSNCFSIDIDLSLGKEIINNEVERIIKSVVETENPIISDCFFSFSNKDYDEMLQKAELVKMGLLTFDGKQTTNKAVTTDILNSLNTINENTSLNEIKTVIENSIFEASRTVSETESTDNGYKFNANVKVGFIDNLLKNLTLVLTKVLISPKVYLLLAFNLKVIGMWHPFELPEVLSRERALITDLVKELHGKITKYLVAKIKQILEELSKEVLALIVKEQYQNYIQYYKRCVECFKYSGAGNGEDFQIDKVDYADIYESETEKEENNEC